MINPQDLPNELQQILHTALSHAQSLHHPSLDPIHLLHAVITSPQVSTLLRNKVSSESVANILHEIKTKIDSIQPVKNSNTVISQKLVKILEKSMKIQEKNTIAQLINLLKELLKHDLISEQSKSQILANLTESNTPTLDTYGTELVSQCMYPHDPVIGRIEEIRTVIEILTKKKKSNPILVGPAGVGKTAIVNGIAQLIYKDQAPGLSDYKIYELDVTGMMANTGVRGQFEERIREIIAEASSDPSEQQYDQFNIESLRSNNNSDQNTTVRPRKTKSQKKIILFIDEIHTVINSQGSNPLDIANALKPALASGRLKLIGATTHAEYRKYIEPDTAFSRRFVPVTVNEPSINDSLTILRGVRSRLESHHGIKIDDSALVTAVTLSKRYVPARMLPDIALDLIDTACAATALELESEPAQITQIRNEIWALELERASILRDTDLSNTEKNLNEDKSHSAEISPTNSSPKINQSINPNATNNENVIDELNNKIAALKSQLSEDLKIHNEITSKIKETKLLKNKIADVQNRIEIAKTNNDTFTVLDLQNEVLPVLITKLKSLKSNITINKTNILNIISRWTGIPINRMNIKESQRLMNLKNHLKENLIQTNSIIENVTNCIIRNRIGLKRNNKPIGVFLFIGPSGTGKTELSKLISYELFDSKLVFLDMSDYSTELSITKLVGVSAGYVGYNESGTLTEPVRVKPYNVILLDEIDLAHSKIINILYQIFEEGRVTDGKGNIVHFGNTIIIMTSNLGSDLVIEDYLRKENNIENNEEKRVKGVQKDNSNDCVTKETKERIEKILCDKFGTALINRIDSVCYFNPLSKEDLAKIFDLQIEKLNLELREKRIKLEISEKVKEREINENYKVNLGARPLIRAIEKKFVNGIGVLLLDTIGESSCIVRVGMEGEIDGVLIEEYVYSLEEVRA